MRMVRGQFVTQYLLAGALCVAGLLVVCPAVVWADDDGWEEFDELAPQQAQNHFVMNREQFESWVFQGRGGADSTASGRRKAFQGQLDAKVAELTRSCELNAAQQKKVRLAGQQDIRKFFDQYDNLANKYLNMRSDNQQFNDIWQKIQPLQKQLQKGLFHQDSMLQKVLESALDGKQGAKHRALAAARRKFKFEALVRRYVMSVDKRIPLLAKERKKLRELILAETLPPNRYDQHEMLYLQYHVSQITKANVLEVVDHEETGKALVKHAQLGRGYKHHLKSQGVVPFKESEREAGAPQGRAGNVIDRAVERFLQQAQ